MTSSYRSPDKQLSIIKYYAERHNASLPAKKKLSTSDLRLDRPKTWVPVLKAIRKAGYAVNAPVAGQGIPVSPHTKQRVVFDLSGPNLQAIARACRQAEAYHLMGFNQVLVEAKNHCVHVDVDWVSTRAMEAVYADQGFAYA